MREIFIHAEKDQDIRVKNDTKEWIGNDRHLIVKAKQTELVEGDKHGEVKGDQLIKVGGDMGANITGNEIIKVGGNLHAAATEIHLKASGDARVAGMAVDLKANSNGAFEASANLHIKGGAVVVIEGGAHCPSRSAEVSSTSAPPASRFPARWSTSIQAELAGSGGGAQAASPESPDAPAAAAEASDAEPGLSDEAMTAPAPPEPKKFSPSALAMQEAAENGSPMVEA